MSDHQYAYPFDPTGQASTNTIINERHTINPPDYLDFYFVIPSAGPFFQDNLVVRHWPSGQTLIEGVDFILGYQFLGASRATAKPVYGAVSIYDRKLTGVLEITYNTLGGQWTIDEVAAAEMLSNAMNNPRITTWEQVVEQPATFPVIDHEWDLVDLVGGSEVVEGLDAIREAIESGGANTGEFTAHANLENNPHNVTKAQVGLGLVQNYPMASINEGNEGALNNRYMTPIRVKSAVEFQVGSEFRTHADDFENPHQVTKTQVGLGQVSNFLTADDATARAGLSEAHFMTPANVLSLVDEKVGTGVGDHIANLNNPHSVTKAQVGLDFVPNFSMATVDVTNAGTAPDHFMSPYHTALMINNLVTGPLSGHITDRNNPHQVTKTQVGLGQVSNFLTADDATARAGLSEAHFMTPANVLSLVDEKVGTGVGEHVTRQDNPHSVTKAQVGLDFVPNFSMATVDVTNAGTAPDHFMSPYHTALMINNLATGPLSGHITDRNNPHQVTKTQVGLGSVRNFPIASDAESTDAVATDRYMTPYNVRLAINELVGGSLAEHPSDTNNPHNVTKAQVGLNNVGNFAMATDPVMGAGTSLTAYVSPKRVADYIANGVASDLKTHKDSADNPHGVTKIQVGLSKVNNFDVAGEIDSRGGTRSDLYVTPQGAKWAVDSFVTGNYGNLSNRLNVLETTQTDQTTEQTDHIANLSNPHGVSLAQLDGMSQTQIESRLLQKLDTTGLAQDSIRLDGLTLYEIYEDIEAITATTYVTNVEITQLTNALTTSFEDGMWALNGGNVIRLQPGNLNAVFAQTTDRILGLDGNENSRWVAVGSNGLAGYSIDNGLNWNPLTTGVTEDIGFVRYVGGAVWVFATATGEVHRSVDGGATWALSTTLGEPAVALETKGTNYVLAVSATALIESSDAGGVWSAPVDLSGLPALADATVLAPQDLYLATALGLYTWTGVGTEALVVGVPNTVPMQYVESDTEGRVVSVEQSGVHHRYSPVNGAWQQTDQNRQLKQLIADEQGLWAAVTLDNRILRSIDGGRVWAEAPTTPVDVTLRSIGSGPTGWMFGGDGGTLFLSID